MADSRVLDIQGERVSAATNKITTGCRRSEPKQV